MLRNLPQKVTIVEVGARDGLQNETTVLGIEDKCEYIKLLADSGVEQLEVTSFVKESAIPQMGDASELYEKVRPILEGKCKRLWCLTPNQQGLNNALKVGVRDIALFSSTSNSFNKKNINCDIKESFKRFEALGDQIKENSLNVRGYVSTVFGCPYEGDVSFDQVKLVVEKFSEFGVDEISLGDTIGVATPGQVDKLLSQLKNVVDFKNLALHFHDTRGMAVANILVALEHGIRVFDSSSAGLGGCPYAKGASGNVATEDLLYLFNGLGIETSINLDKLIEASDFILSKLNKVSPSKFFNVYVRN
ncbi:MAG: hydroxymethylglutaryl-CoA lyase [Bacteriovoracaceae bacterium]|nr:hydroxymethylglutaryl-CoA lyase [Bacteriovoracaceae bacterium]